jgi:hypothetical protein
MKNAVFYRSVSFILLVQGGFSGCSKNDSVSPVETKSYSVRELSSIPIEGERSLRIVNRFGGVLVNGYMQDGIDTYLFKTVTLTDPSLAQTNLDAIQLTHRTDGDTLSAAVLLNNSQGGADHECWVSLDAPYTMDCVLDSVVQQIRVYNMDGTLDVQNAEAGVEVSSHSGSLRIATRLGDIGMETVFPDSGFCIARTGFGNIVLRIPQSTSATVRAFTRKGIVGFSNLNWTSVAQQADSLSGILAEGHGEILLESQKGNIELIGF